MIMSTESVRDLSKFFEALAAGQPDALVRATKEAYAAGADFRDLLLAVEAARMRNGIAPLVIERARTTVCTWQWIADRRRALA
jgi:hypothetical protein